MSIYLGENKISANFNTLGFPLFTPIWQDHILNNASWLRSDTFSWQSGSIYTSAYAHLVEDIDGITSETETISGTTITFYRATDGHKIVLADQETNINAIYNATGIAWYYILDTDNTRFKLPRSKWSFVGYRDSVGKYVAESLPNIQGELQTSFLLDFNNNDNTKPALQGSTLGSPTKITDNGNAGSSGNHISFDASWSSSTYQNDAPVQQRATQMYLYFYIGNTVQGQTEINIGQITEDLNGKANTALDNVTTTGKNTVVSFGKPDMTAGVTVTSGTVLTDNGWLLVDGQNISNFAATCYIDGIMVFESAFSGTGTMAHIAMFQVYKGQTITYTNLFGCTFFPLSIN